MATNRSSTKVRTAKAIADVRELADIAQRSATAAKKAAKKSIAAAAAGRLSEAFSHMGDASRAYEVARKHATYACDRAIGYNADRATHTVMINVACAAMRAVAVANEASAAATRSYPHKPDFYVD